MPAPATTLITGATRGIGFEFTRQCLERGDLVFAGCRTIAGMSALRESLDDHPRLRAVLLDVERESMFAPAIQTIAAQCDRLDFLIHNAGIGGGGRGLAGLDPEQYIRVFRVNYLAPLLLTRAALPLLVAGSKVAALTSRTGALRPHDPESKGGGGFAYGCSKAALHRLIPMLATDLRAHGILVCGLDPGWVRTEMTATPDLGNRYQLEPEQSVCGMLDTLDQLTAQESGQLKRWNGSLCQWYAPTETDEELQICR